MIGYRYIFLICFFISSLSYANCEVRINNATNKPATARIKFDNGLVDSASIMPQRSLFINLYYSGYCHQRVYLKIRRNAYDVFFAGYLKPGTVLTIPNLNSKVSS
tara:strand:- start:274 stop:588 length:315 start_codon:yes stop_codon:yes gene_type:complete